MVSIEPYALANSKPPALPAVRAEPNLLQRLHPLSAPRRPEVYFGPVDPRLQQRPDLFGGSRIRALSSNTPISKSNKKTTLHDPRPALDRPWPRVVNETYHRKLLGSAARFDACQAAATYTYVENCTAVIPSLTHPALLHINSLMSPSPGAQPFLLIARVKLLLEQQKIREARRTLEIGSSRHPANRQIASLLRAISPGQVSATGRTSSGRDRETAWIKQHGHEYRGKWIALEEDCLIAFAATLNELLACLETGAERKKPPFVQLLISE